MLNVTRSNPAPSGMMLKTLQVKFDTTQLETVQVQSGTAGGVHEKEKLLNGSADELCR